MPALFGIVALSMKKVLLKKIQYDVARILTGLTSSVSMDKLLREVGWMSLADRRRTTQKLISVFKYNKGALPIYLNELFPNTALQSYSYNLRNTENYTTVACGLQIYSNSVKPSSVKHWNNLDVNIRNCQTLSSFKLDFKKLKRHMFPLSFF